MSAAVITACLWVVAATIVAMLPMRRQYAPGLALLLAAPLLIAWIWIKLGWILGACALAAFVSMFRHPLRYLFRKATGRPAPLPEDPIDQ
ncbi:MAG: DUF2484 family protein [Pseudomonadota bacterium]